MLAAIVDPETMQVVTAVAAVVAGAGALVVLAARLLAATTPAAASVCDAVARYRNALTVLIAGAAMAGSLYFSEVAHYVPCRLCWFQRIAMYPIAAVALVGVIRRDAGTRWFVLPLAGVGMAISAYHYLIEWRPSLDTGGCALFGPACTDIWFRTFGFATLAFMALCGFVAILVVNFVPTAQRSPLIAQSPPEAL